jgi:hypothetical protein
MLFDPREQRPGIMQAHVDAGMLLKEFDERQIGVFVGLFEHVTEIATGLVGMNQQDEMKAFWHGDNFALKHHTVRRNISDSKDDKNAPLAHFSWTPGAGPGGTAGPGD